MPRAPLSEAEIDEFRKAATEAATQIFSESGLEGLTMRALAKALGCSPMTPYRYFPTQEHLLAELRARAYTSLSEGQERAVAGLDDPVQRIRACRDAYIQHAVDDPNSFRLCFNYKPPDFEHEGLTLAVRRSFAPLQAAVQAAVAQGLIDDEVSTAAHLIWAECHGLAALHLSDKLNFDRSLDVLRKRSLFALIDQHN